MRTGRTGRCRARFHEETRQPVTVRCKFRGQYLDGDFALQTFVVREENLPHSTPSEQRKNFITPDFRPRRR